MKKLVVFLIAAFVGVGFTYQPDANVKTKSDCPYLNQTNISIGANTLTCPYLGSKLSNKDFSEQQLKTCPYSNGSNKKSLECPYLKQNEETKIKNEVPKPVIKLKSS